MYNIFRLFTTICYYIDFLAFISYFYSLKIECIHLASLFNFRLFVNKVTLNVFKK